MDTLSGQSGSLTKFQNFLTKNKKLVVSVGKTYHLLQHGRMHPVNGGQVIGGTTGGYLGLQQTATAVPGATTTSGKDGENTTTSTMPIKQAQTIAKQEAHAATTPEQKAQWQAVAANLQTQADKGTTSTPFSLQGRDGGKTGTMSFGPAGSATVVTGKKQGGFTVSGNETKHYDNKGNLISTEYSNAIINGKESGNLLLNADGSVVLKDGKGGETSSGTIDKADVGWKKWTGKKCFTPRPMSMQRRQWN